MNVGRKPAPALVNFRPDIEGLRAVAVLAVVLFHAGVPAVGGGFVGVDVFFVISGFLITGLLWREVSTTGGVRLRRFYGARARRLLPASATVGIATAVGSAALLPLLQVRPVLEDGIASALYVSNFRFAFRGTDYFFSAMPASPFLHYWSLGVEEQFYLVWPTVIIGVAWLIRRVRRQAGTQTSSSVNPYFVALVLVCVVSFVASLAVMDASASIMFFSPFTRAWEFAVGGLVALTAHHWTRLSSLAAAILGWAGLGGILLACVALDSTALYPGTAALLPVLSTALVIGAGCAIPAHGVGRALSFPPMGMVGRISYSWYVWHWPVLLLVPPLLGHPLGLAGRLAAVIVSLGLATLTLRFVENPFRFDASLRGSAVRSLALGGVATALVVGVSLVLLMLAPLPVGRGAPAAPLTVTVLPPSAGHTVDHYDAAVQDAFAQVQAAVARSTTLKAVPSNVEPALADTAAEQLALPGNSCMRDFFQVEQPECAFGDTRSPTMMALIGDSNAAMWNPAFEQIATQRHWRLESLDKAGCPMLDLPLTTPILHREYTECEQWRDRIMARLRAEHPRLVVLSVSRTYRGQGFTADDPAWLGSLTRLVRQLGEMGARVLVLGPIPDPQTVVPVCLSGHLDDAMACAPPTSTAINSTGIAAETAAVTVAGGQYADLTPLFCSTDRCPVIVGNTLVYLDEVHVTVEYSRLLTPVMGLLVDRALIGN